MAADERDCGALHVGRQRLWPPIRIETSATPAQMRAMFDRVGAEWKMLGEADPHWSVLTAPEYKGEGIAANEEAFYATGAAELVEIECFLRRSGVELAPAGTVLELGCGVGRLTCALAERVREVVAVDISAPHLDVARRRLATKGIGNVRLAQLTRFDDLAALPKCDLLMCFIVLQHNPPPVMAEMLATALARVRPGGHAAFQVASYLPNYSFSVADHLASTVFGFEMHAIPQAVVFEILRKAGFQVLQVEEDTRVGSPEFLSHTFLARRDKKVFRIWK